MQTQSALPVDPYDKNHYIGAVSQIGPSSVQVAIPPAPTTTSENQIGVGSYVIIACGELAIFGQIKGIRGQQVDGNQMNGGGSAYSLATAELMTTINIRTAAVSPGATASPQIGTLVYTASSPIIRLVAEMRNRSGTKEEALRLEIATLDDVNRTVITFTPEKIYGRHCAVLGTTGGGKSWSVARLVEESARFHSKIVLFDPSGEYHTLARATRHVYVGEDPNPLPGSLEVSVPYYELTEGDLFAIFKPRGQSQAPKLRAAMKSLKLARLAQGLAPNGTIIKAHKSKIEFQNEYDYFIHQIESPKADFDISKLTVQIENECVNPNRSANEPFYWGGPNSLDHSACVPMMNRIHDILQTKSLAPIFDPQQRPSLLAEIEHFLQDDSTRVLRISLAHLSFLHNTREIVANAIGRRLLAIGREWRFREKPMLIVLDEAHQFLNRNNTDENLQYTLDSFSLIAKEGRKYSLSICIATQRPRDIPDGVLSQMGTLIIHRLISDDDRHVVERASGNIDRSALESLPALGPGEVVIVGVDFPIPIGARMIAPHYKPDSRGPDYQRYWF